MMPWWKPEMRRRQRGLNSFLDEDPKFRCCGCCHVQTGTICLGVYNLLLQVVCMSVLVFAILHPDMLLDRHKNPIDREIRAPQVDNLIPANEPGLKSALEPVPPAGQQESGSGAIVDPDLAQKPRETLAVEPRKQQFFYSRNDMMMFTKRRVQSGDAHLALALVFGLVIITGLMIYGAIKSRPVYLLPFFCFQVFDFILACLTAVGHYTWLPNIHESMMKHEDMPFRDHMMRMNGQWVALVILLLYVLALMVKAYFIGVVWACYQYLQVRNAGVIRYSATEADGLLVPETEPELLLPPDYETATKLPPAGPPPGYSSS